MKKSKWISFAKFLIFFFMIVLFINATMFFREVRRDVLYGSRSYGLDTLNEYFDNGEYQKVYYYTICNKYADDELSIDVSQYEAFGRYYRAYTLARIYEDNDVYLKRMAEEKEKITWKKILNVIGMLENEMNQEISGE